MTPGYIYAGIKEQILARRLELPDMDVGPPPLTSVLRPVASMGNSLLNERSSRGQLASAVELAEEVSAFDNALSSDSCESDSKIVRELEDSITISTV